MSPAPRLVVLVGGSDPAAAAADLAARGATVIVGTPGRTADAVERVGSGLDFKRFDLLVVDEADRVLESATFRAQVDAIVERSWVDAQRRALDTAFVVVVLIFAASTFLRGPRPSRDDPTTP